jgi:DNA end-binding protein Ku
MARQLVGTLEGPFEPERYRDEYRGRVLELVQRKARGEKVARARKPPKRAAPSLAEALRKSIAAASGKPAARERRRRAHG